LVNGKCDVLKGQCRRSNGGLWYESYDEFEGCLNFLLTENEIAQKMAANGKRFVDSHYSLDQIKAKYIRLIDRFLNN
jgi:glycosyltransferase involved in cell wall biosynthesis